MDEGTPTGTGGVGSHGNPARTRLLPLFLILSLLTALCFLTRWQFSFFSLDDAFITYQHAENLAAGHGFTYTPPERVLATTTPLHTLLLAATCSVGADIEIASKMINAIADCLTALLIFFLVRLVLPTRYLLPAMSALLYIAGARMSVYATSGMETSLFTMFVVLALYLACAGRQAWAAGISGVATLIRPEGLLVAAAVLICQAYKSRTIPWVPGAIFAVVVLPWIVFATYYFGSPISQSIAAKASVYQAIHQTSRLDAMAVFVYGHKTAWLAPAVVGVGLVLSRRLLPALAPLVLFWCFYVALFVIRVDHVHPWYVPPSDPAFWVFVSLAVWGYASHATAGLRKLVRWVGAGEVYVAATAMLLLVFAGLHVQAASAKKYAEAEAEGQTVKRLALELRQSTPPDWVVCAADIGRLGYYSQRRILDYIGLVSPEAVEYTRARDFVGLLRARRPEIVCLADYAPIPGALRQSDWFNSNYELTYTRFTPGQRTWLVFVRQGLHDDWRGMLTYGLRNPAGPNI